MCASSTVLNARWMVAGGAAVALADAELDARRLADEVTVLVRDRDRRLEMRRAALRLARPDAAERIAAEVLALAARRAAASA